MQKIVYVVLIIVLVVVAYSVWQQFGGEESIAVTNFEECIAAGNPAMESYPRQCRHGDETFVEEIEPFEGQNTPTSADNAPPGGIHNLPVPDAVAAVRGRVASELGISEGIVIVMTAYEREWPNACLGLVAENEMCAQVITSGYEVTVQAGGKQFTYHTNSDGSNLREKK